MNKPIDEYYFCRMAHNQCGWQGPHQGRRQAGFANDYIDLEGFGQEDWNFANDVWADGKLHLSLRGFPTAKVPTTGHFTIVLYEYLDGTVNVIGLARKAKWATSKLRKQIWKRRAQEVMLLADTDDLSNNFASMSKKQLRKHLENNLGLYCISVEPMNLERFETPIELPKLVYIPPTYQYRKLKLTRLEFDRIDAHLKSQISAVGNNFDHEDVSSEEGRLLQAKHKYRERNSALVRKAKRRFVKKHGKLFCEACSFEPSAHFVDMSFQNKLIEAHHDIWLSSDEHTGTTKTKDLRMLCPNCHRAIHWLRPRRSVAEFINYLSDRSSD